MKMIYNIKKKNNMNYYFYPVLKIIEYINFSIKISISIKKVDFFAKLEILKVGA